MKRLLSIAAAFVAAAATLTAIVVGGGVPTSSAKAASPGDGLSAYVVPSNRQPLPACSQPDFSDCTVLPTQVVNTADRRLPSKRAVRPSRVVVLKPVWQRPVALVM
jgi:hypothetical protein